jgi:Kef-type K+ transport system membrane component KefB/predicted transcriptional regulator
MGLFASAHWPTVLTLGILLSAALAGGYLAQFLRLPRVTAYLLVGLLFAPATLQVMPSAVQGFMPRIDEQHLAQMEPLEQLAMALVLFTIGSHFPLTRFRKILRRVFWLSAGEIGFTFVLVGGGLILLPLGISWQSSILFASLAIATAPATTILVLKENESEGPVTEFATALVAINNLMAVVLFEVFYRGIHYSQFGSETGIGAELGEFAAVLFGSVALGLIGGVVTSFACGLLSPRRWLVLLVGMSTLLLGICELWNVPYLLTFLAMGATVANSSDHAQKMVAELDRFTGLLCVVFFVIHGAAMDVGALQTAGWIGVAYIALRLIGKYFGVFFTADAHLDGHDVKYWLGATMFAQAGAAIALSSIAADELGEMGVQIRNVILGTVIVFEIGGPILTRIGLLQSGEVPLGHAIRHTSTTVLGELRSIINRLASAVGMDPFSGRDVSQLKVEDIMRKNIKPIPASASFDEVVEFLEHSHDNNLPVVDNQLQVKGVLRYENLRHSLFDPDLGSLVRAEDLAVPAFQILYPDDSVEHAWHLFHRSNIDSMMVVTREQPQVFVGLVRRRELFRLFLTEQNKDSKA